MARHSSAERGAVLVNSPVWRRGWVGGWVEWKRRTVARHSSVERGAVLVNSPVRGRGWVGCSMIHGWMV